MLSSLPKAGLSAVEFCDAVGIGLTMYYKLRKAGLINTVKVGRRTIVPATEPAAFLARMAEGTK